MAKKIFSPISPILDPEMAEMERARADAFFFRELKKAGAEQQPFEAAALWAQRFKKEEDEKLIRLGFKSWSIKTSDTRRSAFFNYPMVAVGVVAVAALGGGFVAQALLGTMGFVVGGVLSEMDQVKGAIKKEGQGNLRAFQACMRYAGVGMRRGGWRILHGAGLIIGLPVLLLERATGKSVGSSKVEGAVGKLEIRAKRHEIKMAALRRDPEEVKKIYARSAEGLGKMREEGAWSYGRPDVEQELLLLEASGAHPSWKPEVGLPELGDLITVACAVAREPLGFGAKKEEKILLRRLRAREEALAIAGELVPAKGAPRAHLKI